MKKTIFAMTSAPEAIPVLPDNAPFTLEQRAYLNGFLAGLFSRGPAPDPAGGLRPQAAPLMPLSILFGSQTGNAEGLARRIAKAAGQRGFAPTIHDLSKYPVAQLPVEERLLIVTSTFGDGEPPDNARAFWEFLSGPAAPRLAATRFSVCALGDSNYPKFCGFGRDLDARFAALGAQQTHPRAECDLDFEAVFAAWLDGALESIGRNAAAREQSTPAVPPAGPMTGPVAPPLNGPEAPAPKYSRSNPFPASLIANRKLNGAGSEKETRHFEIALETSGLNYEVGDALGVLPSNCPELVAELLSLLKCSGDEPVPGRDDREVSLCEALTSHYEITRIPPALLAAFAERVADEELKRLTAPGVNGELTKFLRGREIIDLLLAHPAVRFTAAGFIRLLRKLPPRLYSISSSPKAHPGHVHLTVSIVRYESLSRRRKGVCSTFLADRVAPGSPVPVFVHSNKNFRPPSDAGAPMIMVGPGTGVAPFRAFLEERRATGARGENWLFFGDQRAASDFLYRDELESLQRAGTLTRFDTAFSRDQAQKIYVQDRMRERGKELFGWLEAGAHFYVCGDASRMAKDVDAALHEIVQTHGSLAPERAAEYVARLKAEKRYQRDVY